MTQVSGLVGRADLMCALFTLAALFSYRKCLDCKRNGVYNTNTHSELCTQTTQNQFITFHTVMSCRSCDMVCGDPTQHTLCCSE